MALIPSGERLQVRFELYMKAKGLSAGDSFAPHDYILWIHGHSNAFKKRIGKAFYDILTTRQQAEFTEYIATEVG